MHNNSNIIAGVLVGGRSRRMGQPKALLPHPNAGTFVEHIVAEARQVVSEVFLLGLQTSLPVSLRDLPWLPDVRENSGPLAGLCSLLNLASNRWVLLLACDLPLLGASVLHQLVMRASPEADAVAFAYEDSATRSAGSVAKWHACCTLYHSRLLSIAQRELVQGRGSLQQVLRSVRLTTLQPNDEHAQQLCNVNTTEDFALLTALAGSTPGTRHQTVAV